MDIHHNWIREGEYIQPTDDRVKRVIDSWRGVRPTLHYSVSREDCLVEHSRNERPAHDALIEAGYSKQKLRAHSDYYWNEAVNNWALTFIDKFDMYHIQDESNNVNYFEKFRRRAIFCAILRYQ